MDGATTLQLALRLVYITLMMPSLVAIGCYGAAAGLERISLRIPFVVETKGHHVAGRPRQLCPPTIRHGNC